MSGISSHRFDADMHRSRSHAPALRAVISVVPQDVWPFHRSALENIRVIRIVRSHFEV